MEIDGVETVVPAERDFFNRIIVEEENKSEESQNEQNKTEQNERRESRFRKNRFRENRSSME